MAQRPVPGGAVLLDQPHHALAEHRPLRPVEIAPPHAALHSNQIGPGRVVLGGSVFLHPVGQGVDLQEAAVVVAPGTGYGALGEGYVRISLTVSDQRLQEAMDRIRRRLP